MSTNSCRLGYALLAGLALGLAGSCPVTAAAEAPGLAPDFALKALDGYNYRLSEYRGEVVAVVFWASWCGGCRHELERLQGLSGVYGNAGMKILGVTVDEQPDTARAVAAAIGADFPQLLDSGKSASKAYRLESLPTTLLIDRSGMLRYAYGELDARGESEMLGQLRMLLDE